MLIGAHVSIAGGISKSVERAHRIGCETFQIFTKNQMRWKIPKLDGNEIVRFRNNIIKFKVSSATVHASYLVNIASPDKLTRTRSLQDLYEDLLRADKLGIKYLVFHPGAHKGKGEKYALDAIADGINELLERTKGIETSLLLETTAGEGTNVGYKFEHLAYIINKVKYENRLGVCVDTCHIFSAGYDFRDRKSYDKMIRELSFTVSIEKVKAFHLNDSKKDLGSKLDRHEEIGKGKIGIKAFEFLMNDNRFGKIPGILETPGGEEGYKRNILLLKSLRRYIWE